eukprot:XP_024439064.1 uncharacterized protein LOC112323807 [Populus trichocarpa]
MVHSWIINTLISEISDRVIYYSTTQEVWEDLHYRFSQSNVPRIFEIQRDIACLRQDQLSISAYYTKLKGLWDELAFHNDTVHGAQQDQQTLMQFLMELNDSYSAICGQILLINPLPTVRQVCSSISQEENQRLLSSMHAVNDSVESTVMVVRGNSGKTTPLTDTFARKSDQDKRRFGSRRGRPFCSHCGEPGHWVQTCYELYGYPAGHPKARHNSGSKRFGNNNKSISNHVLEDFSKEDGKSVVGISETQLKQLLSLLNDKNEGPSSQAHAVTKPGLPKVASRSWIIDSWATGSGYEDDDWFE